LTSSQTHFGKLLQHLLLQLPIQWQVELLENKKLNSTVVAAATAPLFLLPLSPGDTPPPQTGSLAKANGIDSK